MKDWSRASLTDTAAAIASGATSSRDVVEASLDRIDRLNPLLHCFIEVDAARGARRGRRRRQASAGGRQARATAWRAGRPQGHVLSCRARLVVRLEASRRLERPGHGDGARSPRSGRCDRDRPSRDGRVRHGAARLQSELSAMPQSMECRSHSMRFLERIGCRGGRANGSRLARFGHRRLGAMSGRRIGRRRPSSDLWTGQPARRDADVLLARLRRSARADCARLRATAGRDRRARSRGRELARCTGSGLRGGARQRGTAPADRDRTRLFRCRGSPGRAEGYRRLRPPICDALAFRSRISRFLPISCTRWPSSIRLVMKAEGAANHLDTMRDARERLYFRGRPPAAFRLLHSGCELHSRAQVARLLSSRIRQGGVLEGRSAPTPVLSIPVPSIAETSGKKGKDYLDMVVALTGNTKVVNYFGVPAISVPCGFTSNRHASGVPAHRQAARRSHAAARRPSLSGSHRLASEGADDSLATPARVPV